MGPSDQPNVVVLELRHRQSSPTNSGTSSRSSKTEAQEKYAVGPSHASSRKRAVCIGRGDRRCKSVPSSWSNGSRPRAMAASRQLTCAMGTVGEAVNAHPSSNDRKVVGFRRICGKEEQTNAVHHIGRIETTADPTPPPSPPPQTPNQTNHRQSSGQTGASIDPVPPFPPPLDPPDRKIRQRLPSENG